MTWFWMALYVLGWLTTGAVTWYLMQTRFIRCTVTVGDLGCWCKASLLGLFTVAIAVWLIVERYYDRYEDKVLFKGRGGSS